MTHNVLYSELIAHLQALPAQPSREDLLRALQAWLQRRIAKWRPEHRNRWGLDQYVGMDLSRYPVDSSSLNPSEELRQLRAVPPSSMDVFAMRLRDILWEGVTVESPVECPRCGDAQLKILEDDRSRQFVLACDLCVWAQTSSGERWTGGSTVRPPVKERVDHWRAENASK